MSVWDQGNGFDGSLSDAELEVVLSEGSLGPEAPAHARALAEVLADLKAPATHAAASGEAAALAAFRGVHVVSLDEHRADDRRADDRRADERRADERRAARRLGARRAKISGGVAAAVLALTLAGGTAAAAALGGNLPGPWPGLNGASGGTSAANEDASRAAATSTAPATPSPTRSDGAGKPTPAPAAKPDKSKAPAPTSASQYGLCREVLRTGARTLSPSSAAHRALTAAAAAHGQSLVEYCGAVVKPGSSVSGTRPVATESPGKSDQAAGGKPAETPATPKGKPATPPGKPDETNPTTKADEVRSSLPGSTS